MEEIMVRSGRARLVDDGVETTGTHTEGVVLPFPEKELPYGYSASPFFRAGRLSVFHYRIFVADCRRQTQSKQCQQTRVC